MSPNRHHHGIQCNAKKHKPKLTTHYHNKTMTPLTIELQHTHTHTHPIIYSIESNLLQHDKQLKQFN